MRTRKAALSTSAAFCLALLASAAAAQDEPEGGAPREEVVVRPPPSGPQRSAIGAPIVEVSLSRTVRYDDLDLRNEPDVGRLRARVRFAAETLCRRLNAFYPIGSSDGPWTSATRCFRDAVANAMGQVDEAVRARRGYGGNGP